MSVALRPTSTAADIDVHPSDSMAWTMPMMAMHDCKQCQLPNKFSALGQLGYLRKSESMSGHVPVLFMCCEYHFLDGRGTIMNFLFLINSYSKNFL